jgi:hypothetical protein
MKKCTEAVWTGFVFAVVFYLGAVIGFYRGVLYGGAVSGMIGASLTLDAISDVRHDQKNEAIQRLEKQISYCLSLASTTTFTFTRRDFLDPTGIAFSRNLETSIPLLKQKIAAELRESKLQQ